MNLHVLGAGSIGCLFAHHISKAGWPVTLLMRPDTLAAFERAGRVVRCGDAGATCSGEAVAPNASSDRQQPIHNLLVTTKVCCDRRRRCCRGVLPPKLAPRSNPRVNASGPWSPLASLTPPNHPSYRRLHQANQTADAIAAVAPRLSSDSVVILLQNGVLAVHEQLLRQHFRDASARPQFLLGSTTHGAWRRRAFDVVWHEGTAVFGKPGGGSGGGGGGSSGGGREPQGWVQGSEHSSGDKSRMHRADEVLRLLGSPELASLKIDASLSPQQLHEQVHRVAGGPCRLRASAAAAWLVVACATRSTIMNPRRSSILPPRFSLAPPNHRLHPCGPGQAAVDQAHNQRVRQPPHRPAALPQRGLA